MNKTILVCDVGFGYTKFIEAEMDETAARVISKNSFPTVIRRLLSSSYFEIKNHPDFVEITSNGESKSFLVGNSAVGSEKGLRIRDSDFFLDYFPVILERVLKEKKTANLNMLVIGTPFQEWNRLKDHFIEKAKGYAEEIECYPQAAAAACLLGSASFNSLVVDLGYNTADVVPVDEQGRILSDRGISWEKFGMSVVLEDLENLIKNIFGLSFNLFQIEQLITSPASMIRKNPVLKSVKETAFKLRDNAIKEYANLINLKLIDRFGRNKKIILAGGGAKIVVKYLKKAGLTLKVMPDPQFANAKGFLKLGLAKMGFKGHIEWPEKSRKSDTTEEKEKKTETLPQVVEIENKAVEVGNEVSK